MEFIDKDDGNFVGQGEVLADDLGRRKIDEIWRCVCDNVGEQTTKDNTGSSHTPYSI